MANVFGRTKQISYWMERVDGEDIEPEFEADLEEAAMKRIIEMLEEGYLSGELFENIRLPSDDSDDGVEFQGGWDLVDVNEDRAAPHP